MANVIHRTREEGVYDGSTGQQIDTHTYHEIGIEVDGVFVPFATKQGTYVDALVERGKAAKQADETLGTAPESAQGTNPTGEPTPSGEAAQNIGTPGTSTES